MSRLNPAAIRVARAATAAAAVFSVLLAIGAFSPVLTTAAGAAVLVAVTIMVSDRKFAHLHREIDALTLGLSQVQTGMIAIDHAHDRPRVLGSAVDVRWNPGTVAPDLAEYLIQALLLRRPKSVLECGCGVSTLILASALRTLGQQHQLLSLEHDGFWAGQIRSLLEAEQLSACADVVEARLEPFRATNRCYSWYSARERVEATAPYDLVFVDGPPAVRSSDAGREAALYALFPLMRPGALLVLDDGNRPGERAAVAAWQKDYADQIRVSYVDLKRGLWVIEKV